MSQELLKHYLKSFHYSSGSPDPTLPVCNQLHQSATLRQPWIYKTENQQAYLNGSKTVESWTVKSLGKKFTETILIIIKSVEQEIII